MTRKIFVNLPVKNLQRSVDFFTKLGFSFDPKFTDQNVTSMIVGDNIHVMMIAEDFFRRFTKKEIGDATKTTESITSIELESKTEVDEMYQKAIDSGGYASVDAQDHGWMYMQSFQDPDGHQWEVLWIDPAGPPPMK